MISNQGHLNTENPHLFFFLKKYILLVIGGKKNIQIKIQMFLCSTIPVFINYLYHAYIAGLYGGDFFWDTL